MGNIPVLKPAEIVSVLRKFGFVEIRQKGSHKQFKHSDGRITTVPFLTHRQAAWQVKPEHLRKANKCKTQPIPDTGSHG
ncbi:MAG: type II toxin-antitoxin system HicA family toxin [Candidatus Sumerlaeota bacterium]